VGKNKDKKKNNKYKFLTNLYKKKEMFTEILINTFLMAGLPFLLNIYLRNKNRKPEDRIERPKTKIDKIASLALIIGIIYEIISFIYFKPPSIFKTLNIPSTAPNWLFQNHYREYLVDKYGQEFASFDPDNIRPNQLTDNLEEIREFAHLFNQLKDLDNRATYLKYGEVAYTQCTWCESDGDYLLFTLSRSSLKYIYILALLGAVTSTTRKNIWRFWSVVLVVSVALIEIFMYLTPQEGNILKTSLFETIKNNRHGLFIGIMALVWLFDRSDEKTEEEITQEAINRLVAMVNRLQAIELCNVSTLTENTLRKIYMDYYEKKEVEKSVIFSSPEYNDVRLQVIAKYNLEKMIEESNQMSEDMLNSYRKLTNKEIPQKNNNNNSSGGNNNNKKEETATTAGTNAA